MRPSNHYLPAQVTPLRGVHTWRASRFLYPATLVSGGAPTAPVCSILVLDIGAIHLDLLGLVVDLAPVHLNVTGQTGPGRLLENLLCGLAGLLNPPGPLAAILDIIARINALLRNLSRGNPQA